MRTMAIRWPGLESTTCWKTELFAWGETGAAIDSEGAVTAENDAVFAFKDANVLDAERRAHGR